MGTARAASVFFLNGNVRAVRTSAETGWGGRGECAVYSEGSSIRGTNSALVAGGNLSLRVSRSMARIYARFGKTGTGAVLRWFN